MSAPPQLNYPPIRRARGVTPAENYLGYVCESTFLSLWSYQTIYRDQRADKNGDGKEICDLLVVFGNDVIIFSDKHCQFLNTGDLKTDWRRWFCPAILKSAHQVWGAERWLRSFPDRVFLDRACKQPFPLELPNKTHGRFHLIVVAHGISKPCREQFGGSGSLLINTDLKGESTHVIPFAIGDLNPHKTFVHVLDDTTLNILMQTVDTVSDLTSYLRKKEAFLRSGKLIFAAGEEELLACYLREMNQNEEHDFVYPIDAKSLVYDQGLWDQFKKHPQRLAQIGANRISYAWDELIERSNRFALDGTQFYCWPRDFASSERVLRFLAREPRIRRRMLARAFVDALGKTPRKMRRIRVATPSYPGDPYFVFVIIPPSSVPPDKNNRTVRLEFLEACCKVVKIKYPDALDIVGIATETGISREWRSEDIVYLDARYWNDELEAETRQIQQDLEILIRPTRTDFIEKEYPEVGKNPTEFVLSKNPRNKPCPCGSGKKYKKCHGSH